MTIFAVMNKGKEFEGKRVTYCTLGCKLNFTEMSHIGRALSERGMQTVEEGEQADYCVVNTCSVTELADKKSRQMIRRLHREHPGAKIIVTGCYAQLRPEEIAKMEGVDLVIGAKDKGRLIEYLLSDFGAQTSDHGHIIHSKIEDVEGFSHSVSSEGRTRHFLKVQDGCDYHCSYCTIPKARGKSRNGRIEDLVSEAAKVAHEGGKEIVLTGVNVGDFGRSTGDKFIDLVRALDEVEGIYRFRISSIEPNLITDEIIKVVANSKRFAPHFHIPLQSGSDDILKLMRRRYNRELFRHKVELIKSILPDAFIGVDVIVGMRGETPEYFEDAYCFIESLPISKLHVFSYSERPGTDALNIDYVVDTQDKQARSQRLIALSEEKHKAFYATQTGTIRKALLEHSGEGEWLYGFTENYIRIRVPYDEALQGEVVSIRVGECLVEDPEVCSAELIL